MWTAALVIAIVIPLTWTILGMLNYGVHSGDTQFGTLKSFLFILILPVVISEDVDLASLVARMGILMVILTFGMVAIYFYSPAVFLMLYTFSIENHNAIISASRDVFGSGVGQFYYKTSALMIFPFSYYCGRLLQQGTKWLAPLLMVLLYGAALMFSGTRANLLAAVFVAGILALRHIRRKFGLTASLAVAVVGIILVSTTLVSKFADPNEQSNSVKLGHLRSYEEEFGTNPSILLWGQGADTGFYSEGFDDWTTVTELSYMELVRVFGIPITILFCVGLAWIGYAIFTKGAYWMALAYVSYLAISASNPLLISSTGFVIICAAWKEAVFPSEASSAFHLADLRSPPISSQSGGDRRLSHVRLRVSARVGAQSA